MSAARVSVRLRAQVLADALGRCGYCRSSEDITGALLEIEHLIPEATGGPTRRDNLWAACRQCNAFKTDRRGAHARVLDRSCPVVQRFLVVP